MKAVRLSVGHSGEAKPVECSLDEMLALLGTTTKAVHFIKHSKFFLFNEFLINGLMISETNGRTYFSIIVTLRGFLSVANHFFCSLFLLFLLYTELFDCLFMFEMANSKFFSKLNGKDIAQKE